MKKKNLKEKSKIILLGFLLFFNIIAILFSISILALLSNSQCYNSDYNIDDQYNKISPKTKKIIEDTLKNVIKNENVSFVFSQVYEDVNENYALANDLSPEDNVIIYYNANSNKLGTFSDIKELKDNRYEQALSKETLDDSVEELVVYIYDISNKLPNKNSFYTFFFDSHKQYNLIGILITFIIAILIVSFIFLLVAFIANLNY